MKLTWAAAPVIAMLCSCSESTNRGPDSLIYLGLRSSVNMTLPENFHGAVRVAEQGNNQPEIVVHEVKQQDKAVTLQFTAWEQGGHDLLDYMQVEPDTEKSKLPRWEIKVIGMASSEDLKLQHLERVPITVSPLRFGHLYAVGGLWLLMGVAGWLLIRQRQIQAVQPMPLVEFEDSLINKLIQRASTRELSESETIRLESYLIAWLQRKHGLTERSLADALKELNRNSKSKYILQAWETWKEDLTEQPPPAIIVQELTQAQSSGRGGVS